MQSIGLSLKNIAARPLSALLSVLLVTFGTGIITVLLLVSQQLSDKLGSNSKDIDLVVGAKGSPLQLILSSVYHADLPTGNILKKDADSLALNPMVKRAVPLALGDNYKGSRIVGTDTSIVGLYDLKLAQGRFWKKDFEVTVGAQVAIANRLKTGSTFYGAHGLVSQADVHRDRKYTVTGILEPRGNVTDNLVFTTIPSVWIMHGLFYDKNGHLIRQEEHAHGGHDSDAGEGEAHHQDKDHDHDEGEAAPAPGQPMLYSSGMPEITSMLIQYRSPLAVVMFPRMVNQGTVMQAASPAMESARLFSLIGMGLDTLRFLAALIIFISAVSVFVSLYQSLKERRYEMAVLRTLGASRFKLLRVILAEAVVLTLCGTLLGMAAAHFLTGLIGGGEMTEATLTGKLWVKEETGIIAAGLALGIFAGLIPAVQAYRTPISKTLAKG